jgi:hypothetical protein
VRKNRSLKLEIIALVCSVIVIFMSAAPLFDRHNDAQILTLIFGSAAAGVALGNLIRKSRERKKEERH